MFQPQMYDSSSLSPTSMKKEKRRQELQRKSSFLTDSDEYLEKQDEQSTEEESKISFEMPSLRKTISTPVPKLTKKLSQNYDNLKDSDSEDAYTHKAKRRMTENELEEEQPLPKLPFPKLKSYSSAMYESTTSTKGVFKANQSHNKQSSSSSKKSIDDTQKEQRFPIVNGIEILAALQYLNETGRLKHLKSNNDDENMVNEKISQIKKDERYAVLTDFSGKFFSNDSSQLKKDLQSLAYFQKQFISEKIKSILLFTSKEDAHTFNNFKSLIQYQNYAIAKQGLCQKGSTESQSYANIIQYTSVLQEYEDALAFLIYLPTNSVLRPCIRMICKLMNKREKEVQKENQNSSSKIKSLTNLDLDMALKKSNAKRDSFTRGRANSSILDY